MTILTITLLMLIGLVVIIQLYLYIRIKVLEREYIKLVGLLDGILKERELLYQELFSKYNKDKRLSDYVKRFQGMRRVKDE